MTAEARRMDVDAELAAALQRVRTQIAVQSTRAVRRHQVRVRGLEARQNARFDRAERRHHVGARLAGYAVRDLGVSLDEAAATLAAFAAAVEAKGKAA